MISTGNKKKNELLGIPFGTACSRLRKLILFNLAQKLKMDICYRCKKPITTVDRFSIDHKDPWASSKNPIKAFFDVNKIAFSHIGCNTGARYSPIKKYTNSKERKREWAKQKYHTNEEFKNKFLKIKRDRYNKKS